MSAIHIMKDPLDLDPFSEKQVDLTRHFDAEGKSSKKLIYYAFKTQTVNDIMLMQGMALSHWQRACYESHQLARSNPEDKTVALMARTLWHLIQYIQASTQLSMEVAGDKEMVEFFRDKGVHLPKIPED